MALSSETIGQENRRDRDCPCRPRIYATGGAPGFSSATDGSCSVLVAMSPLPTGACRWLLGPTARRAVTVVRTLYLLPHFLHSLSFTDHCLNLRTPFERLRFEWQFGHFDGLPFPICITSGIGKPRGVFIVFGSAGFRH